MRGSFSLNPLLRQHADSIMADSSDRAQLLHDINQKLQHIEDCFECFQDFKNIAFVGNSIKAKLNDCCIGAIVPFDYLLDRFLDILETFDSGVKHPKCLAYDRFTYCR